MADPKDSEDKGTPSWVTSDPFDVHQKAVEKKEPKEKDDDKSESKTTSDAEKSKKSEKKTSTKKKSKKKAASTKAKSTNSTTRKKQEKAEDKEQQRLASNSKSAPKQQKLVIEKPKSQDSVIIDPALKENEDHSLSSDKKKTATASMQDKAEEKKATPKEEKRLEKAQKKKENKSTMPIQQIDTDPVKKVPPPKVKKPMSRFGKFSLFILLAMLFFGALLIYLDYKNTNRYVLRCNNQTLAIDQANGLPWPFGYRKLQGLVRPIKLSQKSLCTESEVHSIDDAEAAYLTVLIAEIKSALNSDQAIDNQNLSSAVDQAAELTRKPAHIAHRRALKAMIADISYRQGRAKLEKIELDLRAALVAMQKAQRYGDDRYDDLDDWIDYIKDLIKGISPSPPKAKMSLPNLNLRKTMPSVPSSPMKTVPQNLTPSTAPVMKQEIPKVPKAPSTQPVEEKSESDGILM